MDRLSILNQLLKETTNLDTELKADTSFNELYMDEYTIVDFLMRVEETFNVTFDDTKLLEVHTMQDVMNMIAENSQEDIEKC